MTSRSVAVRGGTLEVSERGSGDPVVFIQTALTADELWPVATDPELDAYRRILYPPTRLRRERSGGPAGIDRPGGGRLRALLGALGIERAHVVGLSFSGAVALQLAAAAASPAHSLVLIEPPPLHTPSSSQFRAANDRLLARSRDRGHQAALDEFLTMLIGPDWHQVAEGRLPGSPAQMRQDAATFFDVDLPALLSWSFTADDAAGVRCPVMYVGGTDSGPWFAEVRDLLLDWFPRPEGVVVHGAGHSLVLTHAREIAEAVATFLRRKPLEVAPAPSSERPGEHRGRVASSAAMAELHVLTTAHVPRPDLVRLRALLDESFEGRFSDDDWAHALGGHHVIVPDQHGWGSGHLTHERELPRAGRRA